jgi:hypothetical protein
LKLFQNFEYTVFEVGKLKLGLKRREDIIFGRYFLTFFPHKILNLAGLKNGQF